MAGSSSLHPGRGAVAGAVAGGVAPPRAVALLALVGLALLAAPAAADEFWYAHLPNSAGLSSTSTVALLNGGSATGTVDVTDPGGTTTAYTVPAGGSTLVALTVGSSASTAASSREISGYKFETSDPVRAVYFDPITPIFSNDAGRLREKEELGKEHIAQGIPLLTGWSPSGPFLTVVATEAATTVTVTPTAAILAGGGIPAIAPGTSWAATLAPHEVLHLVSSGDLAGTRISSDKPVAVYVGDQCLAFDGSACDHVSDAVPHLDLAGTSFVHCTPTPVRTAGYDLLRFVAATGPATVTVTETGGMPATFSLAATGAAAHAIVDRDAYVSATAPVLLWSFLGPGHNSQDYGDPSIVSIAPTDLWTTDHMFYSPAASGWAHGYTVAAPLGTSVLLDGAAVPLTAVAGTSYGCAAQSVLAGMHEGTSSAASFATSFGHGWAVSYHTEALYPPPPPVPPIAALDASGGPIGCEPGITTLDGRASRDPDGSIVSWEWDFGDGTTGTGPVVTHEYAAPGTYLVTLTVTDSYGMTDTATLWVVASEDPNCPPTIVVPPGPVALVGDTIVVCVTGTDPDDDPLQFVAWRLPDGATFDLETLCMTWVPAEGQQGRYCIPFGVTDGQVTDSACSSITVRIPTIPAIDTDRDGTADDQDNCPETPNKDQADLDRDGQGDVCDPQPSVSDLGVAPFAPGVVLDADGDGIPDGEDACPRTADPGQADLDLDRLGDACDIDADGDGIAAGGEFPDVCPLAPDADQADTDGDGVGDACDAQPGGAAGRGLAQGDATAVAGEPDPAARAATAALLPALMALGAGAMARRRR